MTTLAEILKDETNLAVIFGHVHRRQRELAPFLLTRDRTIAFDRATAEDLLDYDYILAFHQTLSQQSALFLADQVVERDDTRYARCDALACAGVSAEDQQLNRGAASSRAHHVMFGKRFKDYDTYEAIVERQVDAQVEVAA